MSGQLNNEYEELVREPRKVRWVWLVYLLLYVITIPWYWPAGYRGPLVAGFPLWVVVTLCGVLLPGRLDRLGHHPPLAGPGRRDLMGAAADQLVFGTGALVLVGLYLLSMLGIGWIGRLKRQSNTLADFYLAGRSMGFLVLFLTLYATQYSGNTLFGYTGKTYRIGFEWTVSILFMFSIIAGYLLFAPRLVLLARKMDFITPGDYISHRFKSPFLTLLSTILMIYALGNYTLAQLKAMGAAVEGITDGWCLPSTESWGWPSSWWFTRRWGECAVWPGPT